MLRQAQHDNKFFNMTKLFAHRGFASKNIPQNSIASLKHAYEFGFRAVEFDVWFLNKKLILKHDRPTEKEIENLANFHDYFFFGNELIIGSILKI
jgi:glycerophosphoryl diester phosphodiesterase